MKKIILILLMLMFGFAIFSGCSMNNGFPSKIGEYILESEKDSSDCDSIGNIEVCTEIKELSYIISEKNEMIFVTFNKVTKNKTKYEERLNLLSKNSEGIFDKLHNKFMWVSEEYDTVIVTKAKYEENEYGSRKFDYSEKLDINNEVVIYFIEKYKPLK